MPRDLFGSGTAPTALTRAFSRYTVLGSLALHLVIIAVVLIVPLLADDVLPRPDMGRMQFVTPAMMPTPPPVATTSTPPRPQRAVNPDLPPIIIPTRIVDEQPATPTNASPFVPEGPALSSGTAIFDGFGSPDGKGAPPPPIIVAPRQVPTGPVRPGGLIREPVKTHHVAPIYPAIAQSARVEGTVQIEAIISTEGVVQQARVVSGSPLLSDAALSAVRQWRYTPTTLNNQPVAVIMTVTVKFTLQH